MQGHLPVRCLPPAKRLSRLRPQPRACRQPESLGGPQLAMASELWAACWVEPFTHSIGNGQIAQLKHHLAVERPQPVHVMQLGLGVKVLVGLAQQRTLAHLLPEVVQMADMVLHLHCDGPNALGSPSMVLLADRIVHLVGGTQVTLLLRTGPACRSLDCRICLNVCHAGPTQAWRRAQFSIVSSERGGPMSPPPTT
jgi:hypothetical protein